MVDVGLMACTDGYGQKRPVLFLVSRADTPDFRVQTPSVVPVPYFSNEVFKWPLLNKSCLV